MPPSISGTPQRRQKTPRTASSSATRRSHHSASSSPPATACPAIAAITGLRQPQPGRPHRAVPVGLDAVAGRRADGSQVGAGAERAALAVQDGDRGVRVGVERAEGVRQRRRGAPSTALRACGRDSRTVVTGPVALHRDRLACASAGTASAAEPRRSPPVPSATGSPAASSASTICCTSGLARQVAVPTRASAHTDCTVRFSAPSSRAESGGVTVSSCVVQIDTQVGPSGVSSPRVEPRRAGRCRWPSAGSRAGTGRARRRRRGRRGCAVVRRAQREHPADDVAVPPSADPQPRDHPAGRVAHDVDAVRAGARQRRVHGLAQRVGGVAQVAGAVAGQPDDGGVPARRGQHVGQRLHRARPAAVARHEQHRTGPVLRDRLAPRRRRPRHEHHRQARRGHDDQRQDGEDEAPAGGGETRRALPYCPCCPPARRCAGIGRGSGPVLSREEYLAAWSRWHGGAGTESRARARLAVAGLHARAAARRPAAAGRDRARAARGRRGRRPGRSRAGRG